MVVLLARFYEGTRNLIWVKNDTSKMPALQSCLKRVEKDVYMTDPLFFVQNKNGNEVTALLIHHLWVETMSNQRAAFSWTQLDSAAASADAELSLGW